MQKKIQGLKARAISKNKRIMGRAFSPRNIFGLVSLGVSQGYYVSRRWRFGLRRLDAAFLWLPSCFHSALVGRDGKLYSAAQVNATTLDLVFAGLKSSTDLSGRQFGDRRENNHEQRACLGRFRGLQDPPDL